ncbi:MAG: Ig-like domain-containing protein [Gemmatimonadales bacterium]
MSQAVATCITATLALLVGCTDGEAPLDPAAVDDAVSIAPALALIPSPADAGAAPVSRIRALVTSAADGAALATEARDVSPSAASWPLTLSVPLAGGPIDATLHVQLLHVDGEGAESVQFSGASESFTLRRGDPASPELTIVRGPPENLLTTSVTIASTPPTLDVGDTLTLVGTAGTSGSIAPTIFWTSLDPGVATLVGSRVTAVAFGTARIVASAGAFADTLPVNVRSPDGVPPQVVGVLPAGGATGVSVGALVSVSFDEPLDPASVTASSLVLNTSAGVSVAGSVTYADSTIVFDPTAPLDTLSNYVATLAPGVRDAAGNALAASFQWSFTTSARRLSVASSFDPNLGALIGVAFDQVARSLFLYDDFTTVILEYTTAGVAVPPTIPSPGTSSNDYDLEFLPEAVNVGGTVVPANTLIVMNGEDTPLRRVYALDKSTGAVLDSTTIPMSDPVGLSYHATRNTFFGIDWTRDVIEELDPATGAVLASFPVAPVGAPAWDTFYGDVEVDQRTGSLILVSSSQPVVRILSATGALLADVDVGSLGVTNMAGIAWDDATATAWITTTSGDVWEVAGIIP